MTQVEIKKLASEVSKGTKTEIEAKQALDQFIKNLPNASAPGKTLKDSASLRNIQNTAGTQLSNSVAPPVLVAHSESGQETILEQALYEKI